MALYGYARVSSSDQDFSLQEPALRRHARNVRLGAVLPPRTRPEHRKVVVDARIFIGGTAYPVEPDMAGKTVVLLWGLFDDELYVEFDAE